MDEGCGLLLRPRTEALTLLEPVLLSLSMFSTANTPYAAILSFMHLRGTWLLGSKEAAS
jgi:hypothetical protein